jgi:hypothetical protein
MIGDPSSIDTRDLRPSAESYLLRHGWNAGSAGQYGELWSRFDTEGWSGDPSVETVRIAVPYRLERLSREYQAFIARLEESEQRAGETIAQDLENEFLDIQEYRISNTVENEDSAPLTTASTVLVAAKKLLRAASTTSRRPMPSIGSRFSRSADAVANRARLSHTRRGSYILPVVMPIERGPVLQHQILDRATEVEIETDERRVTRTLASALAALDSIGVRPEQQLGTDGLIRLIESGVSRELVGAVRSIASDAGVHAFETTFGWAPGIGIPGGLPTRIFIPDEAVPLLERIETQLREVEPRPQESVSGQIVEIRHAPDDPAGEIAIWTARGSRTVEVRIRTKASLINEAADWFKAGRAVLARGAIIAAPGRPLLMPNPTLVAPLDVMYLETFHPRELRP